MKPFNVYSDILYVSIFIRQSSNPFYQYVVQYGIMGFSEKMFKIWIAS